MNPARPPICDAGRLRERMAAAGIDLLLASSKRNVAYLTDHQTAHWTWEHAILHMMEKEYDGWDYQVFAGFPRDAAGETFLVEYAHREEAIRRRGLGAAGFYGYWRQGRRPEVAGPGFCLELDYTRTAEEAAAAAVRERGLEAATLGVEMPRLPAQGLERLKALLPRARFVDAFDLLFDARQIKTEEELRRLREAYRMATEVYRELLPALRSGATPRELLVRELDGIYRRGGSFGFAHLFFGDGGQDIAYTPPADRPIAPGDVGLLDLGVVYEGYGTDYARMAQVLPDGGRLSAVYPVVLAARKAVEEALRPGARASDVFLAGARALEAGGLCAAISNVGHGLGLDCHEKPFLTPYSDDTIAPGQAVVIEIYCEVRGVGPILLEDGGVVMEEGWRAFDGLPLDVVMVP